MGNSVTFVCTSVPLLSVGHLCIRSAQQSLAQRRTWKMHTDPMGNCMLELNDRTFMKGAGTDREAENKTSLRPVNSSTQQRGKGQRSVFPRPPGQRTAEKGLTARLVQDSDPLKTLLEAARRQRTMGSVLSWEAPPPLPTPVPPAKNNSCNARVAAVWLESAVGPSGRAGTSSPGALDVQGGKDFQKSQVHLSSTSQQEPQGALYTPVSSSVK